MRNDDYGREQKMALMGSRCWFKGWREGAERATAGRNLVLLVCSLGMFLLCYVSDSQFALHGIPMLINNLIAYIHFSDS